ncbi:hypothetical protein ACFPRL_25680 [Pseudoclavibacter helvolus]
MLSLTRILEALRDGVSDPGSLVGALACRTALARAWVRRRCVFAHR